MIKVKINGKPKYIPQSWEELSWAHYRRIHAGGDIYKVFTGIPMETWRDSSDVKSFHQLVESLEWVSKDPPLKYPSPWIIQIGRKAYNMRVKLRMEKVGQYLDFAQLVSSTAEKDDEGRMVIYPKVIAIFLQPRIDGEYNFAKVNRLAGKLRFLPFWQVLRLGAFFLTSYIKLTSGRKKIWHGWLRRKPSSSPGPRISLKNGDTTPHSTMFQSILESPKTS